MRQRIRTNSLKEDPATIAAKADKGVLELLGDLDSDVTKPYEVSFWIYIPTEGEAYKAVAELTKQGFDLEVHPSVAGEDWLCLAYKNMVLTLWEIEQLRTQLTILAELHGGRFDGWETKVEM